MTTGDAAPDQSNATGYLSGYLRDTFKPSPWNNCTREAYLWGIGTGAAMGLHRYRMGSKPVLILNVAFATCALVAVPSYYICYKTKVYNKGMLETMMAANEFEHGSKAPEQPSPDDHPFLQKANKGEGTEKEYRTYQDLEKYPKAAVDKKAEK